MEWTKEETDYSLGEFDKRWEQCFQSLGEELRLFVRGKYERGELKIPTPQRIQQVKDTLERSYKNK